MRAVLFILKCIVGIFATVGLLVVLVVVGIGIFAAPQETQIPEKVVLTMDFSKGVVETLPDNPLSRASLSDAVVLRDTLEALEAAAADPRVKGLVARVGRGRLGVAQIQEIRDAVKSFRDNEKFAFAFAESFGEGGNGTRHYYLASAFGRVFMQPSGDLDLTGFLIQSPFLRDALDEIGVEPQVGQREEFKGALATFTENSLPEPQRQNLQQLLDSLLGQIAAGIAEERALSPEQVRGLIDSAPHMSTASVEAGLVDELAYWDQVDARITEAAGEDVEFLALNTYADAQTVEEEPGRAVALVYGLGPVQLAESENDPAFGGVVMGSDTVARAIADAIDDPDIEAIVFRVDSPGGSYVAADTIWREMQRARELGKPVIVSMSGLAASGGYFVAAPAHKIVAQPGTVTGSIGVVAGKFVLSGLWDKLEISWDGVQAGDNANLWSSNQRFDEEGWRRLNSRLDATYEDFTGKVADGRGLSADAVSAAAKGQVWTGEAARDLGLVDELGGMRRALALAAEAIGADPDEIRLEDFPERRDPWDALLQDMLGGTLDGARLVVLLDRVARLSDTLGPLLAAQDQLTADPRAGMLRMQRIGIEESPAF
ncbi:MAG: signal peptide peptidase SppA [Kiloniellales bacterium]|nr:signal peptide peptidase SppA [Kiloniellales bacterium]